MSGKNRKIGLTGGIGAGKSSVSDRLRALGADVLDADAVSRALLFRDGDCYADVVHAFTDAILTPDGEIDRKKLALSVFSDDGARRTLNGIVHPAVERIMHEKADALLLSGAPRVFFDVPLLYESGMDERMDTVILVAAPTESCIFRVMARDRVTAEQVRARMDAQLPLLIKRQLADYVVENDGTLDALYEKVDALYRTLSA